MSAISNAVAWAVNIANDNSHGYDQTKRWGPDYDCSSLIISAWENSGVPVKSSGATYTGNMYNIFSKLGFKDVTSSVNLQTGSGLQAGDILLNHQHHTAMSIGNVQIVQASINEIGKVTGGVTGDQTGREIYVRSYYLYSKGWNAVLRYAGSNTEVIPVAKNYLSKGDKGEDVKEMQSLLISAGYSCGQAGADGEFGDDTEKALLKFQTDYSLEVDAKYGPISKSKLSEVANATEMVYARNKVYTLQEEMMVRTGPGTSYRAKKHSELTVDGQKHDIDQDGALDKGTRITCLGYQNVGNDTWVLTPSGWIAGYYNKKLYIA